MQPKPDNTEMSSYKTPGLCLRKEKQNHWCHFGILANGFGAGFLSLLPSSSQPTLFYKQNSEIWKMSYLVCSACTFSCYSNGQHFIHKITEIIVLKRDSTILSQILHCSLQCSLMWLADNVTWSRQGVLTLWKCLEDSVLSITKNSNPIFDEFRVLSSIARTVHCEDILEWTL